MKLTIRRRVGPTSSKSAKATETNGTHYRSKTDARYAGPDCAGPDNVGEEEQGNAIIAELV